ncbi:hypothetical protein AAF712_000176 [Marasmius tenuissimus]|uniref:Uncharacterized protein n=1 Tax=Marasmius tenuissimus TaxID=585030 RepID=A0ABR3AFQ9_9AGAR
MSLEDRLESLEGLLKRVSTDIVAQTSVQNLLSIQLRPDQDFSEELGPPIVKDSWKLEDTTANRSNPGTHIISTPTLPTASPTTRPQLPEAFRTMRTPNESNDSDSDSDSASNQFYSSDSDGLVDNYTTGMERLTLRGPDTLAEEDENHARFHGKSSSMNLIDATRKFKQLHIQQTMDGEVRMPSTNTISAQPTSYNLSFTRRPEYWRFPKVGGVRVSPCSQRG